jgi:hypothetical protein
VKKQSAEVVLENKVFDRRAEKKKKKKKVKK